MARFLIVAVAVSFFSILSIVSPATAAPLGLSLEDAPAPDMIASFVQVNYSAGSDSLTANGTVTTLRNADNSVSGVTGGTFAISATIDGSGAASAATLTINGTISGGPDNGDSSPLLTGTLSQFGFSEDSGGGEGGLFEFLFTVTGGSLSDRYGDEAAVVLDSALDSFVVSWWASDFNNTSALQYLGAQADTGTLQSVPEPATLTLLALGGIAMTIARRRRNRE